MKNILYICIHLQYPASNMDTHRGFTPPHPRHGMPGPPQTGPGGGKGLEEVGDGISLMGMIPYLI